MARGRPSPPNGSPGLGWRPGRAHARSRRSTRPVAPPVVVARVTPGGARWHLGVDHPPARPQAAATRRGGDGAHRRVEAPHRPRQVLPPVLPANPNLHVHVGCPSSRRPSFLVQAGLLTPGSTPYPAFPPCRAVAMLGSTSRSQLRDSPGLTPGSLLYGFHSIGRKRSAHGGSSRIGRVVEHGHGKGKSSAAFAVMGRGWTVAVVQSIKGVPAAEVAGAVRDRAPKTNVAMTGRWARSTASARGAPERSRLAA